MENPKTNFKALNILWSTLLKKLLKINQGTVPSGKIDLANLKLELEKSVNERKEVGKQAPGLWLDLSESIQTRQKIAGKIHVQIKLYELTKIIYSGKYKDIPDEILDDVFNKSAEISENILKKFSYRTDLFKLISDYFNDEKGTNIRTIDKFTYGIKIEVVKIILKSKIISQAELRKSLVIPVKDRSNFKKSHITPLINASIIMEELKPGYINRPLYKISDDFKKTLKIPDKPGENNEINMNLDDF